MTGAPAGQEQDDQWVRAWVDGEDVGRPPDDLLDGYIYRFPGSRATIKQIRAMGRPSDRAWMDGTVYANIPPTVLAQLDRIEAKLDVLSEILELFQFDAYGRLKINLERTTDASTP